MKENLVNLINYLVENEGVLWTLISGFLVANLGEIGALVIYALRNKIQKDKINNYIDEKIASTKVETMQIINDMAESFLTQTKDDMSLMTSSVMNELKISKENQLNAVNEERARVDAIVEKMTSSIK